MRIKREENGDVECGCMGTRVKGGLEDWTTVGRLSKEDRERNKNKERSKRG